MENVLGLRRSQLKPSIILETEVYSIEGRANLSTDASALRLAWTAAHDLNQLNSQAAP